MIPGTSFRRRPEPSVIYIYASTRGHLGSGESRSVEYIATGPIDAFDPGSQRRGLGQSVKLDRVDDLNDHSLLQCFVI